MYNVLTMGHVDLDVFFANKNYYAGPTLHTLILSTQNIHLAFGVTWAEELPKSKLLG